MPLRIQCFSEHATGRHDPRVFIETNTSLLATSDNSELLLHTHKKYWMNDAK